jgi:very-short-patch-repair endonuclease
VSVDSAVAAVQRLGGQARTSELIARGVRKRELSVAVRIGRLIRARHGVYVLTDTSEAVLHSLSHCGALACVTASRDLGLWTLDRGESERVHTWVDPSRHPVRVAVHPDPEEPACCVFHREAAPDPPSLRRVGVLHCLLQILGCHGPEAFFAGLESALRRGLVTDERRAILRTAVSLEHRWLVDFARSDADSGLESILRLRLHRHGITLASQVPIPGVGTVDFVLGDCLILEADGATHGGDQRHADLVRDAVAMSLGFVTLRFDSALILHEWELVETAVLAAIGRGLHRSTAGLTW